MFRLTVITVILALHVSESFCWDETGRGDVYSVIEIPFEGHHYTAQDTPARDVELWATFRHESGSPTFKVYGFWNGDNQGGSDGNVFLIRFCPTKAGKWYLTNVFSNDLKLLHQQEGNYISTDESRHSGFWLVDEMSNGRRWYKRSDGSHPYIVGNTMYSFLSGYGEENKPSGNTIDGDIRGNAQYIKKLRFGLSGDYYVNPVSKPFLDGDGQPTDNGDYSHRPNPEWFSTRVDLAVKTAFDEDLIADLILAGPDREWSRATLRAGNNNNDPTPFLKYIAARYGSYPNVWICLCNEYEIRVPIYSQREIARFGSLIRQYLPYLTPVSVHSTPKTLWPNELNVLAGWYDHIIIQKKMRNLTDTADTMEQVWKNKDRNRPHYMPVVNDELSYQGEGDKHSENDTIEAHLGAFLGGGYGTTGEKPAGKKGQYFRGKFNADEHSALDNLLFLREVIDDHITFWKMEPDVSIFTGLDKEFRGMAWDDHEYVLGTNSEDSFKADLPDGSWLIMEYDMIAKTEKVIESNASGTIEIQSPDSRAVLYHFKKQ